MGRVHGNVRWKSVAQDCLGGFRCVGDRRVEIGRVQKFGEAWFWGPRGSVHWLGPAPSRDEAERRCEEDAVLPPS